MKPIIYMAIGACLPFAAYELMNSKAYKDMMKKIKEMDPCKCIKDAQDKKKSRD